MATAKTETLLTPLLHLSMRWEKLLFMHWPVPTKVLEPLLPPGLKLDTFEGEAWLGLVPFLMRGVHPGGLPSVPGLSAFPELNVRTYVTVNGVPGVWFFSLEAANPIAVCLARTWFHLPYFGAKMRAQMRGEALHFASERTHRNAPPATFSAHYRPLRDVPTEPAALIHFLTARYSLYSAGGQGQLYRADIHHPTWPLQRAEVSFERSPNEMMSQLGLELPDVPPLLHYAEGLRVKAGLPYHVK